MNIASAVWDYTPAELPGYESRLTRMRRHPVRSVVAFLLVGLLAFTLIGDREAGASALAPAAGWSGHSGMNASTVGQILDSSTGIVNQSKDPVTLRSISFQGGLPPHVQILHTAAAIDRYGPPGVGSGTTGWPPTFSVASAPSAFRPLDGFRLPAGTAAAIYVAFKVSSPGCYTFHDPTISADRTGFWRRVPFVGPQQNITIPNWVEYFCAGSPGIQNLFIDSDHAGDDGSPVLFEKTTVRTRGTVAGVVRSGAFIDDMGGGGHAKSWYTILHGTGPFRSRVMNLAPGWRISITSGSCPRHNTGGGRLRIWTLTPGGGQRHGLWSGPSRPSIGYSNNGEEPRSGPTVMVVKTKCSWTVEFGSTGGPIGF